MLIITFAALPPEVELLLRTISRELTRENVLGFLVGFGAMFTLLPGTSF